MSCCIILRLHNFSNIVTGYTAPAGINNFTLMTVTQNGEGQLPSSINSINCQQHIGEIMWVNGAWKRDWPCLSGQPARRFNSVARPSRCGRSHRQHCRTASSFTRVLSGIHRGKMTTVPSFQRWPVRRRNRGKFKAC